MRRWWAYGAVLLLLGAGCEAGAGSDGADGGRLDVVAGFYPVAAAAQRVGGSCVSVQNLTPAGAEPHDLELTTDEVDAIQDADVVLLLGHGFQPAVEDAAAGRDEGTVELLDQLGSSSADRSDAVPRDPHVWLDPVLYGRVVDAVKRALVRADPSCRSRMERNAAALHNAIDAVDADYEAGLRDCARDVLVTAHDAFGHLARRYHLRQEGIAGVSPEEEPNAQRMSELADLVNRTGVTTIFTEELVSPRVADALAREAGGVRTATLNPLEGLTDDQIERGDDWASVMRTNLQALRRALDCT
jgi:zinc transport system substrate-binding protein